MKVMDIQRKPDIFEENWRLIISIRKRLGISQNKKIEIKHES